MRNRRVLAVGCVVLLLALGVLGCSGSGKGTGEADQVVTPQRLRMVTASSGGVAHVFGTAVAQVLQTAGIQAQVETTAGTTANTPLIDGDPTAFGLSSNVDAYEAATGGGWAKGKKHGSIRALFPVYPSAAVMVMTDTSNRVISLKDLDGKVIGMGPAGAGFDVLGRRLFDTLGVKPKGMVNYGYGDQGTAMQDGLINVFGAILGQPASAVVQLEQKLKLSFVGLSKDEIEKFRKVHPYYVEFPPKAGLYKSLTQDVTSLGTWTCFIANKQLSPDITYKIVKAVFDKQPDLVAAVKSASNVAVENVKYDNFCVPLHAGAVQYYREKGVTLPKELIPPEYVEKK